MSKNVYVFGCLLGLDVIHKDIDIKSIVHNFFSKIKVDIFPHLSSIPPETACILTPFKPLNLHQCAGQQGDIEFDFRDYCTPGKIRIIEIDLASIDK